MTMNMRFFIIAAAATLLAACTQENEVQNNPVEARITAGGRRPVLWTTGGTPTESA